MAKRKRRSKVVNKLIIWIAIITIIILVLAFFLETVVGMNIFSENMGILVWGIIILAFGLMGRDLYIKGDTLGGGIFFFIGFVAFIMAFSSDSGATNSEYACKTGHAQLERILGKEFRSTCTNYDSTYQP